MLLSSMIKTRAAPARITGSLFRNCSRRSGLLLSRDRRLFGKPSFVASASWASGRLAAANTEDGKHYYYGPTWMPWMAAAAAGGTAAATTMAEEESSNVKESSNVNDGDENAQVVATSFSLLPHAELLQHSSLPQKKSEQIVAAIGPDLKGLNKALAERHERQKVAVARLLHEFHVLAEESIKKEHGEEEEEEEDHDDETATIDKHMGRLRRIRTQKKKSVATQQAREPSVIRVPKKLKSLRPKDAWNMIDQLKEGGFFRRQDLKRIAKATTSVLKKDPTLIDLRDRDDIEQVTVVGDLHGHFSCLAEVLSLVGDENGAGTPWDGSGVVIFNGDFVDRGEHSLEVMMTLLLLKLAYPRHIFLNRGNHEDSILSTVYGYTDELNERYGKDGPIDDIWDSFVDVFAALPLCARTNSAAIIHGGIPSTDFKLSELEAITPEERFRIKSVLDSGDDSTCQLIQNILWSDPRPENGIHPNVDRGVGKHFGPDVLRKFLSDNGLKLFIRSHEPVDDGYEHLPCSDDHSAVTVFSASSYPNGEGYNWGAVIRLNSDGSFEPVPFPGQTHLRQQEDQDVDEFRRRTFTALAQVIAENRQALADGFAVFAEMTDRRLKLANAFSPKENGQAEEELATEEPTLITREQWADTMSIVLQLPNLDWMTFQPYLAPTFMAGNSSSSNKSTSKGRGGNVQAKLEDSGLIDYRRFLDLHCNAVAGSECMQHIDDNTMDILVKNHSVLLTVFKFLDTDKNGTIDRDEFRTGMEMLRKRFPERQLQDSDEVFDAIDLDGNGIIELEEFEKAFQAVEMPYPVALVKLFDTDRSGTIDRTEFREGLKFLNQRLPKDEQVLDADEMFNAIDANSDGEIDLEELRNALREYFPDL